jgi:hypothetical protein
MSEYSNNWPNYLYTNINQPPSPRTEFIRDSLDRNVAPASFEPRNLARDQFFDPLQLSSANFGMPGSLTSISDDYNFHLAQIEDVSASSIQSLNTPISHDLWFRGQNQREVGLHRSTNLYLG